MPPRLHIICGPMFAGKTTLLIQRLAAAKAAGHHTQAFKPARDDRYDPTHLATHAGVKLSAIPLNSAADILPNLDPAAETLAIDEAHFFGADLIDPVLTLLARGITVIVAGLERDHRGHPFDPFPRLLCEADEVVKLHSACAVCGQPAIHSQRLTDSPDRIVVGGADQYEPRCRACFKPGR